MLVHEGPGRVDQLLAGHLLETQPQQIAGLGVASHHGARRIVDDQAGHQVVDEGPLLGLALAQHPLHRQPLLLGFLLTAGEAP